MKILLDTCVWGGALKEIESAGHDVIWTGEWDNDPGDDEILDYAFKNGRILVTLDKDFGEMVIIREKPHCGILRLVNISARKQGEICLHIITLHGDDLKRGAIITAQPGYLRIRPPD